MCAKKEDRLINELISYLKRAEIEEGERLPSEREMAAMLGASRNTLRNAAKALQAFGVLEVKAGSGYYLKSKLNLDDCIISNNKETEDQRIADQLEAFYHIESMLVSLATDKINENEIKILEEKIVELSHAILESQPQKIIKTHRNIYQQITLVSGNKTLMQILEKFELMFHAVALMLSKVSLEERNDIFAAHVNLLNAIKNKDPKQAGNNTRKLIYLLAQLISRHQGIKIPDSLLNSADNS